MVSESTLSKKVRELRNKRDLTLILLLQTGFLAYLALLFAVAAFQEENHGFMAKSIGVMIILLIITPFLFQRYRRLDQKLPFVWRRHHSS